MNIRSEAVADKLKDMLAAANLQIAMLQAAIDDLTAQNRELAARLEKESEGDNGNA